MTTLYLNRLQNSILTRLGAVDRLEKNRLCLSIIGRRTLSSADRLRWLDEINLQLQLLCLYGLIEIIDTPAQHKICIASPRVKAWLPENLRSAAINGAKHRPSILLPLAIAATLIAGGCGTAALQQDPAPVVAPYNAERTKVPERMEQFVNPANGNRVYRFCVGSECPEPTPKKPFVQRLPVVTEISADGLPAPRASLPTMNAVHSGPYQPPAPAMKKTPPPKVLDKTAEAPRAKETKEATVPEKKADTAAVDTPKAEPKSKPPKAETPKAETPKVKPKTPAEPAEPRPEPIATALPVVEAQIVAGSAEDLVAGWAKLWSEQNAEAYFALYADAFKPANGESAKAWRQARSAVMKRAAKISVDLENVKVIEKDGRATVSFKQTYNSNRFKSRVLKRIELVKVDGQWKIVREVVVPVPSAPLAQ
jgi:hypothetical protein